MSDEKDYLLQCFDGDVTRMARIGLVEIHRT